jgi:hypothetical protein
LPASAALLPKHPSDACALDLYDELARDRVFEVLERAENGRALEALIKIAKRCERAKRDIAGLIADLAARRDILSKHERSDPIIDYLSKRTPPVRRTALDRVDGEIADLLYAISFRLRRDRREALLNRLAFNYQASPPVEDVVFHMLDRLRAYFGVRHDLRSRERIRIGWMHKMTPEGVAVGFFAAQIKKLAGAPLEDAVAEVLVPFITASMIGTDVRRCRIAVEQAGKAKAARPRPRRG